MASRVTRLLQHRRLAIAAESSARRTLRPPCAGASVSKDVAKAEGFVTADIVFSGKHPASTLKNSRWYMTGSNTSGPLTTCYECRKLFPCCVRPCASYSTQASDQKAKQEGKDLSTAEHPFDDITYNIPEKPVTFTEGASYSLVILAGLGIAGLAGYAVFKELIFEPKEYKIFGKALARIQSDSQVTARIGHPITGYGQETRNRAARQRIPNKIWTDEDGVEHVEVNFLIRGPNGAGKVYSEMFKDNSDQTWKFTYLLVDIVSPPHAKGRLMLESYLPA